MVIVFGVTEWE